MIPLSFTFDASLVDLNSLAVPAKCKVLVQVNTAEQMIAALRRARSESWQVLILGEGSNILFTKDYPGLIILNRILGIEVLEDAGDAVLLRVGSGENWHKLVETTVNNDWYGLQNLALIPGLVGAAPVQNIGAYGCELKDTLVSVNYLGLRDQRLVELDRQQCEFSYRDSIFKKALAGDSAITSVVFKLAKTAILNISYPSLAKALEGIAKPTARSVFDAVCEIRRSKLPSPSQIPNAGSFFKNPVVDLNLYQEIKQNYPELPSFLVQPGSLPAERLASQSIETEALSSTAAEQKMKLPAAWLIEQAGWKGKSIGRVTVHQSQALVIINPEGADGTAVLNFARAVQKDIYEKFSVRLEIEPQLI